jgi:hypothetical protein
LYPEELMDASAVVHFLQRVRSGRSRLSVTRQIPLGTTQSPEKTLAVAWQTPAWLPSEHFRSGIGNLRLDLLFALMDHPETSLYQASNAHVHNLLVRTFAGPKGTRHSLSCVFFQERLRTWNAPRISRARRNREQCPQFHTVLVCVESFGGAWRWERAVADGCVRIHMLVSSMKGVCVTLCLGKQAFLLR